MPAGVKLIVSQGELRGQEVVFHDRNTCLIGRAEDCQVKLPEDDLHRTISRHHCLLDINPPDVRIRDFGSLNGTHVNGKKIGQREPHQTREEAARTAFPEYDLRAGDEIAMGNTVFRVEIVRPATCARCAREIPEDRSTQSKRAPGDYQCEDCSRTLTMVPAMDSPRASNVCAQCGRGVGYEVGEGRRGEFICALCKTDSARIVQLLLDAANSGDPGLRSLSGYCYESKLGEGGMGAVFLIRHNTTGEPVALKLMLPRVAVDPDAKERFLRETENTRALLQRHVVQLRDSGYAHGVFFFTLEYCEGGSVERLQKDRGGVLPIGEAGEIILQALDGLDYAHNADLPYTPLANGGSGRGRGLVHRDLKPGNIFLSCSGSARIAKVGDFGLAKAFDLAGLSGMTATGAYMGTPVFSPRQQVLNFKYAKPEVDIWALAASFYRMVTGHFPRDFPRGTDPWIAVLETNAVPIRNRDATIPKKLAEVIDHALIDAPAIPFKNNGPRKS